MNPLKRLETEVQGQNLTYNFGATKSAVSQLQWQLRRHRL